MWTAFLVEIEQLIYFTRTRHLVFILIRLYNEECVRMMNQITVWRQYFYYLEQITSHSITKAS